MWLLALLCSTSAADHQRGCQGWYERSFRQRGGIYRPFEMTWKYKKCFISKTFIGIFQKCCPWERIKRWKGKQPGELNRLYHPHKWSRKFTKLISAVFVCSQFSRTQVQGATKHWGQLNPGGQSEFSWQVIWGLGTQLQGATKQGGQCWSRGQSLSVWQTLTFDEDAMAIKEKITMKQINPSTFIFSFFSSTKKKNLC